MKIKILGGYIIAKFQPIIKWTGSKRSQSENIISYFPKLINTYYEPFIGGGSVLRQLLESDVKVKNYIVGDTCKPLIELWNYIKDNPLELLEHYTYHWNELKKTRVEYYYKIRTEFNNTYDPLLFFFLTRTSVNGLVRFNSKGEFNSAFNHLREGIHPDRLRKIVLEWSDKIQPVKFNYNDYKETLKNVSEKDFIYFDPPYADTDTMYFGKFNQQDFFNYLEQLNNKNIKWLLSYDGFAESENVKRNFVPKELYKEHIYLKSGISGFRKITKVFVDVYESLYINYKAS